MNRTSSDALSMTPAGADDGSGILPVFDISGDEARDLVHDLPDDDDADFAVAQTIPPVALPPPLPGSRLHKALVLATAALLGLTLAVGLDLAAEAILSTPDTVELDPVTIEVSAPPIALDPVVVEVPAAR